jgi:hypothetical protein
VHCCQRKSSPPKCGFFFTLGTAPRGSFDSSTRWQSAEKPWDVGMLGCWMCGCAWLGRTAFVLPLSCQEIAQDGVRRAQLIVNSVNSETSNRCGKQDLLIGHRLVSRTVQESVLSLLQVVYLGYLHEPQAQEHSPVADPFHPLQM